MIKTKLTRTIKNDYRVLWKKGELQGGYKDFTTEYQAKQFINTLK